MALHREHDPHRDQQQADEAGGGRVPDAIAGRLGEPQAGRRDQQGHQRSAVLHEDGDQRRIAAVPPVLWQGA